MQTRSLRILVLYLSLLIHSNNYHILLIEKLSCIKGQTYTKIHPTFMLLPITCIGMQPPVYIQTSIPEIFNLERLTIMLKRLLIIVRLLMVSNSWELYLCIHSIQNTYNIAKSMMRFFLWFLIASNNFQKFDNR